MSRKKKVLVIFAKELPVKEKKWWRQFDTAIAAEALRAQVEKLGLALISLDELLESGSVQEAAELARELSLITAPDGRRVSKLLNYKGYELWWMHYDDLMYRFCLPYTQYRKLLEYIKDFEKVYLYNPPAADLFRYFLESHGCAYSVIGGPSKKLPSAGMLLQGVISLPFLVWLCVTRPKLMVWTSDQFDGLRDHDFRMRFIYEELRKKKIHFVEFIRSQEHIKKVLQHALVRRRPVLYSAAIVALAHYGAGFFKNREVGALLAANRSPAGNMEDRFWFLVSMHYLQNTKGTIWSIRAIQLILKCIGTKAAFIPAGGGRTFHELLACKLLGIPTVGILHGVPSKAYVIYDFMPEFDGEKMLSVDKYGLWSEWWREYYLKNSRAYKPEQLYVSGPMRPLRVEETHHVAARSPGEKLKVLFLSEQLAAPGEILPYLQALMEAKDISLYFKFRPYRDGFEEWLKAHRPDILAKMDTSKVMRGAIGEAIARCDVVVGSHTGGVVEALLQLRPPVFFHTKKWGDYFELQSRCPQYHLYAEDPAQLLDYIKKSKDIPLTVLEELRQMFFGDPYKNGSQWVVEEVEKFL